MASIPEPGRERLAHRTWPGSRGPKGARGGQPVSGKVLPIPFQENGGPGLLQASETSPQDIVFAAFDIDLYEGYIGAPELYPDRVERGQGHLYHPV